MKDKNNPLLGKRVACHECGKTEEMHWIKEVNEKLKRLSLCFTCNFWQEYVETKHIKSHHVIKGKHYVVAAETNEPSHWKGFGGAKFKIKRGQEIITTTNLWHQGEVPTHFRDRLPDTSEFIYDKEES